MSPKARITTRSWQLASLFALALSGCGGARTAEPLRAQAPAGALAAPSAVASVVPPPDPFALLGVVEERDMPKSYSRIQPFAEDDSKWWLNEDGIPKLYGFGQAGPERVVNSLAVSVSSNRVHGLALHVYEFGLFATSLVDGKDVFKVPFPPPPAPKTRAPATLNYRLSPALIGASATNSELAIAVQTGLTEKLLVVDRSSGTLLWETAWKGAYNSKEPALDAEAVYLRAAEGYEARAVRSGEVRWQSKVKPEWTPRWVPTLHRDAIAVTLRRDEITLLDAKTGQERCSIPVQGEVQDAFSFGEQLVLTIGERGSSRAHLAAFESTVCRPRWLSPTLESPYGLRVVHDHLLLRAGDRVVVLDQRGAIVWHYGIGTGDVLAFEMRDGAPRLAITSSYFAAHPLRIFAPGAAADPLEEVAVHGRVTDDDEPAKNLEVYAYGAATRTDEQGKYQLSFQARGVVLVSVAQLGESHSFLLTGKHDYEVDLHHTCEDCE